MINADSRKIHNAVVTDTINYNQHTFLRDADDNVIVDVYEAVLNNGTWEKGEKSPSPTKTIRKSPRMWWQGRNR